ncbi:fructose-2,6-bisphosphatase [Thioalkalivibrio denitrificans]|uniref:Fructose-2,6-bisphosphatase n=2 Tax=Thioalkalivibrio denitrificans TaxID=108003 RepID=A0A1V3NUI9_9GAMM|nr:fructose-2,6-bisphosphatase [Thioalkalivibrio denitrificans]
MLLALAGFYGETAATAESLLGELKRPGHVLVLRHAYAPGTGDPGGFTLDDCSTQRNLSEAGRAQARNLGAKLRNAGVEAAHVYSSRWCRCLETAQALGMGAVTGLPLLDSLFLSERVEIESRTRELKAFLADRKHAEPVILVTHQANIRALVGRPTASGEAVLLRIHSADAIDVVGTFLPDP